MADANETDVREEFVVPFLAALGYKRGTANDIQRETSLKYSREQLGRKKKSDPELRGRPDYILSVLGAGRWILEVKAPKQLITSDDVGQALSYCKHPEVSADYAAVTNGKSFVIFTSSQTANDNPCVCLEISDPEDLAFQVTGILSPIAIRRNCTPPKVDLGTPLAEGLTSTEHVAKGYVLYREASYEFLDGHSQVTAMLRPELDQRMKMLSGYRAGISSGKVFRDDQSRIVANICVDMHRKEMNEFSKLKGFNEADYICLQNKISRSADQPSTFDIKGTLVLQQGEFMYDVISNETMINGVKTSQSYSGHAAGYLEHDVFKGDFSLIFDVIHHIPFARVRYEIRSSGSFEVSLS